MTLDHSSQKKTPFYDIHLSKKAKIVDFIGWAMPVQYSGIIEEVNYTRQKATIFDVSHMGEILVEGEGAEKFLQRVLSNDITKIGLSKAQYTLLCNYDGGVIDDLLVYKLADNKFWLVVNASNKDKDFEWLVKEKNEKEVEIKDESDLYGQIALQGPSAKNILKELLKDKGVGRELLDDLGYFEFIGAELFRSNSKVIISRTGYTGEDGFEIYMPWEEGVEAWIKLEKLGEKYDLKPAGLGARDVLRLEASLPLYGHELSEEFSPLEAGLTPFVRLNTSFIGKEALEKQKEEGLNRKLIGFVMDGRRVPRQGYELCLDDNKVGEVTSGSFSPTLEKPIGMGYVTSEVALVGGEIEVKIRKSHEKAKIVKTPFYRRG
ncbi:glycine cleavage system aminomethyltransferase GcvT [Natranaerofaba carboxydovora]|uniref:glycine cleavage system aminomethyltransferase GcvT n=1 Tax=Natranaerofaba carboxydovora TaxID=2742683 RepID=UPI001F129077|nr:glycine cleavage system aminomethyltransferase GcvT [Natranaerofaba carboxydovora]UMZ73975.1 Aminomethyltransferase [Natranaerofaba carboxydovora]